MGRCMTDRATNPAMKPTMIYQSKCSMMVFPPEGRVSSRHAHRRQENYRVKLLHAALAGVEKPRITRITRISGIDGKEALPVEPPSSGFELAHLLATAKA